MDALEVLQKIQELKEIYGDIEVMVKSNSEGNEFFKKIYRRTKNRRTK